MTFSRMVHAVYSGHRIARHQIAWHSLFNMFEALKSGCANGVSCFYSAATSAVCIVGSWAGWTEQKQEALFTQ